MPVDNEASVNESPTPGEGSEQLTPETEVQSEGSGNSEQENRIPISRAEEMWKRREEKARAEWVAKELDPLRKQMEEWNGRLAKGQLGFMEHMGWYKPEPEKPFTRKEFEAALNERMQTVETQIRQERFEERIRSGWDQVSVKHPKLAGNKYFQEAALASYARNPNIPITQHADEIVKQLLDPHATEREANLQRERDEQRRPDRRVVPSGRGAAGGGGQKEEKGKTVAEKIRSRLAELKGS